MRVKKIPTGVLSDCLLLAMPERLCQRRKLCETEVREARANRTAAVGWKIKGAERASNHVPREEKNVGNKKKLKQTKFNQTKSNAYI
jgi:hypothetical protein